MADSISLHKVEKIKVKESKSSKNSEKAQKIVIEKSEGRDMQITAFGDFDLEMVGDES